MIEQLDRVYGSNVLVRKCGVGQDLPGGRGIVGEDGKPLLYFSQYFSDTTSFVEIIDVGPDCQWFQKEHGQFGRNGKHGSTTLCPEMAEGMVRVEEHFWFIPESFLFPVLFTDEGIQAIGDCIIVDIPKKEDCGIITPDVIEDRHNVYSVRSVGQGVKEPCIVSGVRIVTGAMLRIFAVKGVKYGCLREEDVLGVEE